MHYRPYKPEDFPGLYAIEEVCFQPPHRFGRAYLRQLIQQADAATWIAENAGQMCGFGIVEWSERPTGRVAYVQTLEVLPQVRGQGAGGQLLRLMERSAIEAGAIASWLHVDAENAAAIHVYEKHGYHLRGAEADYYGRARDARIYAKPLTPEVEMGAHF